MIVLADMKFRLAQVYVRPSSPPWSIKYRVLQCDHTQ